MRSLVCCLALAMTAAASGIATAATADQPTLHLPVSVCQGALPSYEGAFRKRPRGIRNEGTAPAFLTCALYGNSFEARNRNVSLVYANPSQQNVTVSCTLVDGGLSNGQPPTFSNTQTLSGPGIRGQFGWTANAHNGGENFAWPALSCLIPPGVEVVFVSHTIVVDVGN